MGASSSLAAVLYAFIRGTDHRFLAVDLRARLRGFLAAHAWSRPTEVVDHRHAPTGHEQPGESPPWDLGISHDLPGAGDPPADWFDEVADVAHFAAFLAERYGREFVLGVFDPEHRVARDLHHIGPDGDPDIATLRLLLDVDPRPPQTS